MLNTNNLPGQTKTEKFGNALTPSTLVLTVTLFFLPKIMFKNTVNKNIGMIRCVTDENHFSLKVLGLTPLILGFPEINFSKLIFEIYRFIKSFYIPNLTNEYHPLTSSDMLSLFFVFTILCFHSKIMTLVMSSS